MKKVILLFFCAMFVSFTYAQSDKIVGIWLTAEGDSQVQLSKLSNGRFSGKIVWMKNDVNAKDNKNPDSRLKDRKIMGLQILNNFSYNAKDNEWIDGTIYDPTNGKTYSCYMWFNNNTNELKIKGYILGMRFLGRQTTWKREASLRVQLVNK